MDPQAPVVIAAAMSGILGGATGAAGGDAWSGFSKWVRSRFERDENVQRSLDDLQAGVHDALGSLASALAQVAEDDPVALSELAQILGIPTPDTDGVSNSVSGTVTGTVIQGRDIGHIELGK